MKFEIVEEGVDIQIGNHVGEFSDKVKEKIFQHELTEDQTNHLITLKISFVNDYVLKVTQERNGNYLKLSSPDGKNLSRELWDFSHDVTKDRMQKENIYQEEHYKSFVKPLSLFVDSGNIGVFQGGLYSQNKTTCLMMGLAFEYVIADILNNPRSLTPKTDEFLENFYKNKNKNEN
jgi:hypothetical protein